MKVQLERKILPCLDQLGCIACHQKFTVPNIRILICADTGLIQGDLCRDCLKLKATGIRQRIQEQSGRLLQQAEQDSGQSLRLRQRALELLLLSQETLTLPNLYQWISKRFEIFSQENQELESARLGMNNFCLCHQRARLRTMLEED
jgi:hypothetical protein